MRSYYFEKIKNCYLENKYYWDAENRLMKVEIKQHDYNDTMVVSFAYNGDGQRIYKETAIEDEIGNDTIVSKIMYVRNSFGEVVEEYVPDEIQNPTEWDIKAIYVFGNGKRIMGINVKEDGTEENIYYLSDILGSNSLLIDQEGNPTMLTKYDEFGNTYYQWEDTSDSSPRTPNYLYTGKPFDKEIGLYYYGARYYNPEWGRWVSRDALTGKISNPQSLNRYIYVLNNPIKYVDSIGNTPYFVRGMWREKNGRWIRKKGNDYWHFHAAGIRMFGKYYFSLNCKVKVVSEIEGNNEISGQTSGNGKIILLSKNSGGDEINTYIHELTHAILITEFNKKDSLNELYAYRMGYMAEHLLEGKAYNYYEIGKAFMEQFGEEEKSNAALLGIILPSKGILQINSKKFHKMMLFYSGNEQFTKDIIKILKKSRNFNEFWIQTGELIMSEKYNQYDKILRKNK